MPHIELKNNKNNRGVNDLGWAVFRRKKETTEIRWMLKLLRTVYQYGLNKKIGTCEDEKGMKRLKSNVGL